MHAIIPMKSIKNINACNPLPPFIPKRNVVKVFVLFFSSDQLRSRTTQRALEVRKRCLAIRCHNDKVHEDKTPYKNGFPPNGSVTGCSSYPLLFMKAIGLGLPRSNPENKTTKKP
ncbi:hypothetical protein CEXT_776551 [Caerostris extrusa]|uniref:Uncharacterized protein n=1 Tax=Caerostris extrusa TaxID=172846 RepID=A0AAV4WHV5_CAEEX|nr:hypothetical protein CEXT_776551 [Caerostris extrusa]